jgi:hypothetical protein
LLEWIGVWVLWGGFVVCVKVCGWVWVWEWVWVSCGCDVWVCVRACMRC